MGEIRTVNDDENVGLRGAHRGDRLVHAAKQTRQTPDDRKEAHDREIVERDEAVEALGSHGRSSDAEKFGLGSQTAQRSHQSGAELIARCFAGYDKYPYIHSSFTEIDAINI
jgi:hypothetical protein